MPDPEIKEDPEDIITKEVDTSRTLIGVELIKHASDYVDKIKNRVTRQVGKGFIDIDFMDMAEIDPTLSTNLLDNFEEINKALELAVNSIFEETRARLGRDIEVHIKKIPKSCNLNLYEVRGTYLGKLISVQAVVRRISEVITRVTAIRFECNMCGNNITVLQDSKKIKKPACGCGSRSFRATQKDTIDLQSGELEELPEKVKNIQQTMQRAPFLVEGIQTSPIFSSELSPGNRVELIGSIVEKPKYFLPKDDQEGVNLITYMIKVNSVQVLETDFESIELTDEDITKIKDAAKDLSIFEKLRDSIAPSLFGLDAIKLALVLQAVEGVEKITETGSKTRGKIHMLLVGDPSTGKSKLLETMYKLAPKARYAIGGASSKAGITAGAVKDEVSGEMALEAGAMVLAHNGLFILDEADKMAQDDSASLHEGMESGTITKTVSGINARLPASCSVLAAANPKESRFNMSNTLASQITMVPSLLSRFDIVYPVLDVPGELDKKIAAHVLTLHMNPKKIEAPYDHAFVRKYLSFAKRQTPKLTIEARDEIYEYYWKLRDSSKGTDGPKSIPITPRQLEALIRLSEASAKIRLDPFVRKEDASRAKSIFVGFMTQLGVDTETGSFDVDKISSSIAQGERSTIKKVRDLFFELSKEAELIEDTDLISKALEMGISDIQINFALEKLSTYGEIYQPVRGKWRLINRPSGLGG